MSGRPVQDLQDILSVLDILDVLNVLDIQDVMDVLAREALGGKVLGVEGGRVASAGANALRLARRFAVRTIAVCLGRASAVAFASVRCLSPSLRPSAVRLGPGLCRRRQTAMDQTQAGRDACLCGARRDPDRFPRSCSDT